MSSQIEEESFAFLRKLFGTSEQRHDSTCKEQRLQQDQRPATFVSMGTMGKISCQKQFEFDWKIQNFSSLPDRTDMYCRSPHFDCHGRSWYLRLIPNGQTQYKSEGFIGLFLMAGDSGPPLETRYSLGLKASKGETEVWLTPIYTFRKEDTGWGIPKGILRSELWRRRDEMVPLDVLTLTLIFKEAKEISVTKDVSVQTEVEHDVADVSVQTIFEQRVSDATVQTAVEVDVADDGKDESLEKTGGEKVLQDIRDLWMSGDITDVVIKVKDVKFKVHRAILTARTPVLCAMFKHDTAEAASGEVTIDDCEPAVFEQLLHFIYTGAPLELNAENSPSLYALADKYLLSEVKALCLRCMQDTMRPDILSNIVDFSLMYKETELLEKAIDFLSRNTVDVMKSVGWQIFLREHSTRANEILISAMELEASRKKRLTD